MMSPPRDVAPDENGSWSEYRRLLNYQLQELKDRQDELHQEIDRLREERTKSFLTIDELETFRLMLREWEQFKLILKIIQRFFVASGAVIIAVWTLREFLSRLGTALLAAFK